MINLVTGSSGFIGSHLVDELNERGDMLFTFDRRGPRKAGLRENFYQGNISFNRPTIFPNEFDEIYHLAAMPWTKTDPKIHWLYDSEEQMKSNILGTRRILSDYWARIFVFTSTANLYGNGRKFTEKSQFNISSAYGYTKAVGERLVSLSGLRHVIYRFGTVVGTRGRCFPNRLVWCALNKVPVKIFNNGETYRDLIDVRDIVSALTSARNLDDGIYNISCGMEISGLELAEKVSNEARERGHSLDYKTTTFAAPGYVPHSTLDISKVLNTGVWEPKISLDKTIADLFDYYEKGGIEPPRWDRI